MKPPRIARLFAAIVSVASISAFAQTQQGPAQTKSSVIELHGMVLKLVQEAEAELSSQEQRVSSECSGKVLSTTFGPDTMWQVTVKARVTPEAIAQNKDFAAKWLGPLKNTMEATFEKWQHNQASTTDTLQAIYAAGSGACHSAYQMAIWPVEAAALQGEVNYNWQVERAKIELQLRANDTAGVEKAQRDRQFWEQQNDLNSRTWDDVHQRVLTIRSRVEASRRVWGKNLWMLIDYATAKTAAKTDGHALALTGLKSTLENFQSPPVDQVPPYLYASDPTPYTAITASTPSQVAGRPILAVRWTLQSGAEGILQENGFWVLNKEWSKWAKANRDESLQKHDILNFFAVGWSLQPDVDSLRGEKATPDAPGISMAIVTPTMDSNGITYKPKLTGGSKTYTVYVVGKKVPTKRSEVKSLQGQGASLHYRVLATMDEIDSTKDSSIHTAWDAGARMITRGMSQVGVKNFDAMPKLLLEVQLLPGVMPGYKKFTINGATGGWFLEKGTSDAHLRIMRDLPIPNDYSVGTPHPGGLVEDTQVAFQGDSIRAVLNTAGPVEAERVELIIGRNNAFVMFDDETSVWATRIGKNEFRTPKIMLVEPGDPRLTKSTDLPKREEGVLYMAVDPGDNISVRLANSGDFVMRSRLGEVSLPKEDDPTAFQDDVVVEPMPGESIYMDALHRAAIADGKFLLIDDWSKLSNQTAKVYSTTMITNLVSHPIAAEATVGPKSGKSDIMFRNRIVLADHAAMIMMRDHFIRKMRPVVEAVNNITAEDEQMKFMSDFNSLRSDPENPLMEMEVDLGEVQASYRNLITGGTSLYYVLDTKGWNYVGRLRPGPQLDRYLLLHAFDAYRKSINAALDRAEKLEDKDIDGLIALTENGFGAITEDLRPRLMRVHIDDATGERSVEPDQLGRSALNGVQAAFDALGAQRHASALDKAVVLSVVSLVPIALPLGILRTVLQLALNVYVLATEIPNTSQTMARESREIEFSRGASQVLGPERYHISLAQQTPAYAIVLNAVAIGGAAFGTVTETMTAVGELSHLQAVRNAQRISEAIVKAGPGNAVKVLAAAAPKERAALLLVNAAAEERAIASTLKMTAEEPLVAFEKATAEEQLAQKALKQLEEEIPKAAPIDEELIPLKKIEASTKPLEPTVVDERNVIPPPPENTTVMRPDGTMIPVGGKLGEKSTFFHVFRIQNLAKVVKFPRLAAREIWSTFRGIEHAQAALDAAAARGIRIPFLRQAINEEGLFVTQDLIPNIFRENEEYFIVSDYLKRSVQLPDGLSRPYNFTPEMEGAACEFFQKMVDADLAFEDFKWDAVYMRRVNGKLEMGILDVDRIARWGDFTEEMNYLSALYERNTILKNEKGIGGELLSVVPAGARKVVPAFSPKARVIKDVREFWELTLERRDILQYQSGYRVGSRSRGLRLESLEKIFPGLRNRPLRRYDLAPLSVPSAGGLFLNLFSAIRDWGFGQDGLARAAS